MYPLGKCPLAPSESVVSYDPWTMEDEYCRTTHEPWVSVVSYDPWHWGWGVIYPVGTLWVRCEFWSNSPSDYSAGMRWVLLKSTHQSTQWVFFEQNPWVHFKGSHQITQRVLFERTLRVLSKSTHQFDQNIPNHNLAGSLWVCGKTGPYWEFIIDALKRTC